MPINEHTIAHVRYNKDQKDFFLVFENKKTAQERGQKSLDAAQKILADKELFLDLRASGQHMLDLDVWKEWDGRIDIPSRS